MLSDRWGTRRRRRINVSGSWAMSLESPVSLTMLVCSDEVHATKKKMAQVEMGFQQRLSIECVLAGDLRHEHEDVSS
eukprot:761413-Hanusia_phi.AAC.6